MTNSINTELFLSSVQKREVKSDNGILGKDDFLKLLIAQLQNQDPLNPMEDKEFISQMATFSSLEQMTNMNQSIEKLVQVQTQTNLIEYSQLVGKEVIWHKVAEEDDQVDSSFIEGNGVITSIQFTGETVKFTLDDGTELTPANISQINQLFNESPLTQASHLIGRKIKWNDSETEFEAIVESVSNRNGSIALLTDIGQTVSVNQIKEIY